MATALGSEILTGLSTAKGLAAIPSQTQTDPRIQGPMYALIKVIGTPIWYTADGTTPVALSNGVPVAVGETINYNADLTRARFLENAPSATLSVQYFRD